MIARTLYMFIAYIGIMYELSRRVAVSNWGMTLPRVYSIFDGIRQKYFSNP